MQDIFDFEDEADIASDEASPAISSDVEAIKDVGAYARNVAEEMDLPKKAVHEVTNSAIGVAVAQHYQR